MPQKPQTPNPNNEDARVRFSDYLKNIYADPSYKAGTPDYQRRVRQSVYDKKLVPFYKKYGLPAPHADQFVDRKPIKNESSYASDFADAYFKSSVASGKKDLQELPSAVKEAAIEYTGDAAGALAKAFKTVDKVASPVAREWFKESMADTQSQRERWDTSWNDAAKQIDNPVVANLEFLEQRKNEWMSDNHVDDFKHNIATGGAALAEFVGEFELISKGVGSAGGTVATVAPRVKYLGNLVNVLNKTERGKLGLHILSTAATSFSLDKLEGKDNKEAAKTAAEFAAMDIGIAGGKGFSKYITGFFGRIASFGGKPLVKDVISGMEHPININDPIGKALIKTSGDLRDKLAQEMFNKNYSEIPNIKDKGAVNKRFVEDASQAPAKVVNKTAVKIQVNKELEEQKKSSPVLAKLIKQLETLNPTKTEEIVASDAVERANTKNSRKTKSVANQILEEIGKREQKRLTTSDTKAADDLAKSVGAAGVKDPRFLPNLLKFVAPNLPADITRIEGMKNKLPFLWGMKHEFPKNVQHEIAFRMAELWPEVDKSKWGALAKDLDTHIEKMRAAGHNSPNDKRGVFRSTNLPSSGKPKTEWQNQLDTMAEVAKLKPIVKNNKSAKKVLDTVGKAMTGGAKLAKAGQSNVTGTVAENAVDKAVAKLDKKNQKEQARLLLKEAAKLNKKRGK